MRRSLTLLLAALCAACTGGPHARGDRQAVLSASYGWPIDGHSLGFDGNGDAENVGVGAGMQWSLKDRWAAGFVLGYRKQQSAEPEPERQPHLARRGAGLVASRRVNWIRTRGPSVG